MRNNVCRLERVRTKQVAKEMFFLNMSAPIFVAQNKTKRNEIKRNKARASLHTLGWLA